MASIKGCLVVIVIICSNCTSVLPEIDNNGWRIDVKDNKAPVGGPTDIANLSLNFVTDSVLIGTDHFSVGLAKKTFG